MIGPVLLLLQHPLSQIAGLVCALNVKKTWGFCSWKELLTCMTCGILAHTAYGLIFGWFSMWFYIYTFLTMLVALKYSEIEPNIYGFIYTPMIMMSGLFFAVKYMIW